MGRTSRKKIAIKDEGTTIVDDVDSIDFVGAGVTGTATGKGVEEDIPGGGGGGTFIGLTDTPSSYSGKAGQYLKVNAGETGVEFDIPAGAGDVVGPASSTDNAVARFDSTTGKILQNSGVTIDDSNNVAGLGTLTSSGGTLTIDETASLTDYMQNLVDDTTPQLGGDLDAQGNDITDLGDITFRTGATGGTLRTGTSNADKYMLQAYDVDNSTYRTLIEADAGNVVKLQLIADYLHLEDAADVTKEVTWDVSGATTSTTTDLVFAQTANRTITYPDATGTLQLQPSEGAFADGDKTKLDYISVTQAVDLDQMETDIAALANGMVYKGDWDASAGSFPGAGSAQTGWFYYVSVGGTVDGVEFTAGDNIVATTDNASTTTYASNWSKHDQTDAVQAVVGLTGSITKSGLLTALNVEDGADVTDETNVVSSLSGATLTAVTVAGTDKVLVQDADDADNLKTVTAQSIADLGGDVSKVGTPADNQVGVWTGDGTLEGTSALTFDGSDFIIREAVNDGNPSIQLGSSATEQFTMTATYDASGQTLNFVKFETAAASASADKGQYRFNVDGVDILYIQDAGINLPDNRAVQLANSDVISVSSGTITLSNIDALDATTEATIESAIDTLANLSSVAATSGTVAYNDANITGLGSVGFTQELDNGSKTASFSIDFGTDQKQKVTLTANTMTLTLDTTFDRVGNYQLKIVNGGLATLTWATESGTIKWAGGSAPTLTSSGTDIISFTYDGTDWWGVASLNFS